jgi:hypothetical protein
MPPNKSKRGKNSNRGSSSKAKPQTPPTPVSESVPQPPKVRRAFLELLEMVDDGKIASVDLDNGKFSEGTKTPESEKFFKFYQQLATDDENLLHYTIKESVGSEGELERRMGLIKWLLKDYPAIFGQENAQGRTALEIAIARYNSKFKISRQKDPGPKRYEVYRKFVLYCLADPSLKKQCVSILDNSTVSESSSNTHIAIKEMGVDIIPYLDLFDRATLERKDHAGNTPLHLAVDVQFWREDEKSEEKSEDEKSEDEISEDEISEEDISDDERSDDEKSDDEKSEKRVELVRKLIDLGREALMITNGPDDPDYNETKRMSPYRYHQSSCLEHHKDPKGIGSCENKSCKGVEFILKDAYMHFQDGTEAIKLLYNGHPSKLTIWK